MTRVTSLRRRVALTSAVAAFFASCGLANADNTITNGGTLSLNGTPNTAGLTGQMYSVGAPIVNNVDTQMTAANFADLQTIYNGSTAAATGNSNLSNQAGDPGNGEAFNFAPYNYTGTTNYQARFSGLFTATVTGNYTFALDSDDGSVMYFNGQRISDLNVLRGESGSPQATSASIALTAGQSYEMVITMFQAGGNAGLIAYYTPPGGTATAIPVLDPTTSTQVLSGSQVTAASSTVGGDATGNVILASGASGTISLNALLNTTFNKLTLNGNSSTLTVSGGAARFTSTTFTGGGVNNFVLGVSTSANDQSLALGQLIGDGTNPTTINTSGNYNLILDNNTGTANTLVAGSSLNIKGGGVVMLGASGGFSPLGDNIAINLSSAATGSSTPTLYIASTGGAGVTFNNPIHATGNSAIVAGQTTFSSDSNDTMVLGSATNGITVDSGATLTVSTNSGYTINLSGSSTVNGTLALAGNTNVNNTVSLPTGATLANSGNVSLNGAITGAGTMTNTGNVNLNVADPAFTGAVNVNGATTSLQNVGALSAATSITVNNTGTLDVPQATTNLSKVIVNSGGILKLDADLSQGVAPTAPIAGTLQINTASIGSAFAATFANNGTIEAINNPATYTPNIATPSGGNLNLGGAGQNLTVTGNVTGSGSLTKNGSETITLSGSNSFTGTATVTAGTLAFTTPLSGATGISVTGGTVNAGAAVNSAATLTLTGGTYNANATGAVPNGAITLGGTLNHTVPATVTGAVSITPNGILQSSASLVTYTGGISINQGIIHASGGTLNLSAKPLVATPGTAFTDGLVEGHITTGSNPSFDLTTPNPANGNTFYPNAPGNITSGPRAANLTPTIDVNTDGGTQEGWVDNETYVYTGKILFPASGSLALGENFDDNVQMKIDGVVVDQDTQWNVPTEVFLHGYTPGYHTIELRFGQGGGGVGASNQGAWTNNLGFGIDYTATSDPGITNGGAAFINPDPTISTSLPPNLFISPGTAASTLQADAGATIQVGQVTGAPNVVLGTASSSTVGLLSFVDQTSTTTSQLNTITVANNSSFGQLAVGQNNIVNVQALNVANGSTLTKTGPGTVVFDGTNAPTPSVILDGTSALNVNGGIVRMNLALTGGGAINVNSGGTLGGNSAGPMASSITVAGTLGPANGGILFPSAGGTIPSILSTTGSVTAQQGVSGPTSGSFEFGATSATAYDQLVITGSGTVTFSGANLIFAPSFTPSAGTQFTLFTDAAGGISGQQFGYVNGAALIGNTFSVSGHAYSITETPTSFVVTAVPEPASVGMLALAATGLLARRRRRD